jgi:hypothetical protein
VGAMKRGQVAKFNMPIARALRGKFFHVLLLNIFKVRLSGNGRYFCRRLS